MAVERGRVAVVTGSTSGIGREVARRLAGEGARVVVTGRDEGRGEEVVREIEASGGEAIFVVRDLEDPAGPAGLVEGACVAYGRVDILVNNGGTLMAAPTSQTDAETFDWAFRLNVRSAFLLVGAVAPEMAERGWGRIVSISSFVGQIGRPGLALYGATKAALEQLTRAWAAEFGPRGVAVNCVAPGPILTPFTRANLGFDDPRTREARVAEIPAGRLGETGDVAAAVSFLVGEEAGYVGGATLNVDGGLAVT